MIFTDNVHLIATTVKELHAFAKSIGLKRHYFHGVKKKHPHYDLTNEKIRIKAQQAGAQIVISRMIVKLCQVWYGEKRAIDVLMTPKILKESPADTFIRLLYSREQAFYTPSRIPNLRMPR